VKTKHLFILAVLVLVSLGLIRSTEAQIVRLEAVNAEQPAAPEAPPAAISGHLIPQADSPISPTTPVKLIFIHHSCGENWLTDGDGDLGVALRDNNYFVSDTNYGWGPDSIGDNTDIPNWVDWFTGPNAITYTTALYAEYGQNSSYSRLASDPGGPNEIIMFKSCYPNSDLYREPSDELTVEDAQAVYNEILTYFEAHQDKLFIAITAPPLEEGETAADRAANARAFDDWLVNDWLVGYAHDNVAVFDFYNVLTSNGGDVNTNDYDSRPVGNHHYWNGSQITHTQTVSNNYSAYPGGNGGGSHPTAAGNQKATAEFVPLLNVFYNRWKGGAGPVAPTLDITQPAAGTSWPVSSTCYIRWTTTGVVTQVNLAYAIGGVTTTVETGVANAGVYTWTTPPTPTTSARVRVESVVSPTTVYDVSDAFTLYQPGVMSHFIYLPLVLRNYAATPVCTAPLTGVTISGSTTGYTNTLYDFTASLTPATAQLPLTYQWSPGPESGQGEATASYQWAITGSKVISVTVSNCGGAYTASDSHTITIQAAPSGDLVLPGDLTYLGAFRLPGGEDPPLTFAYGGNAMTFNPDGDPDSTDAYPGSLFITGHDRQAWGMLPNGSQVAEVSIPVPTIAVSPTNLPQAAFIQTFHDVTAGYFLNLEEIPKIGMQYLNHPDTGPLIHLSWGQHLQPQDEPSHAWFSSTLAAPNLQGVWFIGYQNLYSTNGYMFDIPTDWADAYAQSRYLATGRMRDGGQGGMGPTLFAYRPWLEGGTPPISGTHISETVLLLYENAYNTEEITRCMTGYQHPDEWEGGAWITTPSGKSAVLFAGTKSNGTKYWYGYINPAGPEYACVDAEVTDFTTCRLADGSACPPEDFSGCCDEGAGTCVSYRGWWTTRFDAQFILYDPNDLAQVAAGGMESWGPQPYATVDVDDHLYLNPPEWDEVELGWGDQRRARIGAAAYDRENGFLYVLELYADGAKPVVHVWQVQ
jgi:hypothetical protein